MKNQLRIWSLTVALAGFLFGFDTAVISGADQPIQKLWETSGAFHSFFIMSMALWGTVIGALFGGWPTDKLGRKKTLFWIGVLYLLSAVGSSLAWDPFSFSFFRFIGGLGVGASSVAAPTYISEIAPSNDRGKLVGLYQFNIVFGILVAFLTNFLIGEWAGTGSWRLMLGIESLPAVLYILYVTRVPYSPRWLILHKDSDSEARTVLSLIEPPSRIDSKIEEIRNSVPTHSEERFFSKKYSWPVVLAFLLAFFNQLSGINFVLYYAPRIFGLAGMDEGTALLSSTGIGVVNLVFTMLGIYLIDKAGRRVLMLIGSAGYILSLSGIAWSFMSGAEGFYVLIFVFAFIASHAVGQGAVIWVFISEIFPNEMRAYGQAFGCGVHWVFAALITLVTLPVIDWLGSNPWKLFAFFAGMMVLQLLYTLFMMPETKGVSLEELRRKMIR
jgi:SP family xylose:H+ symportor-like MFS transporter